MSNNSENILIKTTPADNVGIVTNTFGLARGTIVLDDIVLTQDIPMGHKVALENILRDDAVIRYGQIIGFANVNILRGGWVNETNIVVPQPPELKDIIFEKTPIKAVEIGRAHV